MLKAHLVLIRVALLILLLTAPSSWAQDNDLLVRQADESLITTEQKRRALTTLLESATKAENAGEMGEAGRLLNRAGRLQSRLNQPVDGLATYKRALSAAKQSANSSITVDSLNGLANIYDQTSKCELAKPVLSQAISLSEQTGYVAGKAQALLTMSDCENYTDHVQALRTAQQALTLWQSINNKWGTARSYTVVGHYQLAQNELSAATQSHQAAMALWREIGLTDQEAESLIYLGFIEYRKGAWQQSISFLSQAQSMLDEESNAFEMGQTAAGIGEAFIESGLPEFGLTKFDEAKAHFERAHAPLAVAIMFWDIGKAYYLLGRYDDALTNLQRSLTDSIALKDRSNEAMCHDFIGRSYAAMNDDTSALRHFEIALEMYPGVGNLMEAGRTRISIGEIYERQGKDQLAQAFYQEALMILHNLSDSLNEAEALFALGRLELAAKNFAKAEGYLTRSIALTENLRRLPSSNDLTVGFSALVNERYKTLIECLMLESRASSNQELAIRAFETSELERARALIMLLQATQTDVGVPIDPELAQKEKSLRQSLRVKQDEKTTLLSTSYKKQALESLDSELKRLEGEYSQVTETIRLHYPSYEGITRPKEWSLRQIQDQVIIDDQTLLLEYSLGNERSYAWAVTRDGFKSYELPGEKQINEIALRVYGLLQSGDARKAELDQATATLSQMVLFPVAEQLNKHRIIVVADGSLNYIPFQILSLGFSNNEPLIANFEVVNAPSATVLGQLRQENEQRRQPSNLVAAFGDAAFPADFGQRRDTINDQIASVGALDKGRWRHALRDVEPDGDKFDPTSLQRLVYAQRELNSLRELADTGSIIATGFDATREKLQTADLSKYAILHFATHGILDPKRPENSGLFLSMVDRDGKDQNGFIGLQDIYSLRAPVDLVVLSACRTGLGKDVRGEGLIGLTRGFMYAGASSVVASLWKVDDEATSELMKQFYLNMLEKQMTPAAALREAQNTIRQRPEWRSPYYWAAFTIQGEYNKVIRPPHKANLAVYAAIIAIVLLASGGCLYYYLRRRFRRGSPIQH